MLIFDQVPGIQGFYVNTVASCHYQFSKFPIFILLSAFRILTKFFSPFFSIYLYQEIFGCFLLSLTLIILAQYKYIRALGKKVDHFQAQYKYLRAFGAQVDHSWVYGYFI